MCWSTRNCSGFTPPASRVEFKTALRSGPTKALFDRLGPGNAPSHRPWPPELASLPFDRFKPRQRTAPWSTRPYR